MPVLSLRRSDDEIWEEGFLPEDKSAIYIPLFGQDPTTALQKVAYSNQKEYEAKIVRGFTREEWLNSLCEAANGDENLEYHLLKKWQHCQLIEYPHGSNWFLKLSKK
jgi:hypothetical protein